MNHNRLFPMSVGLIGLVVLLGLSSCAGFKLVSQRPTAGHPVDAVAAATSGEESEAPAYDQKAPAPAAASDTTTPAAADE